VRASLRGTHVFYEERGSGDPLLLVHAFPLDHSLWADQIEAFSASHRVIAPDLRGFGQSGDAPSVMTMDDYAADLLALLDHLGVDAVTLCGLSMGGYIALAFRNAYPDRVHAMILCNTRPGADSEEARNSRLQNADRAEANGPAELAESMLPKMLSEAGLAKPELKARVRAMMNRQPGKGVAAALRGMAARPDRTPLLPHLDVPALVIASDRDALIPESEGKAMATAIPGGRYASIAGAGHLSNLDDPAAFNAALREFLGPRRRP